MCTATVAGTTLKLYVDGQPAKTVNTGSAFNFDSGAIAIGSWIYSGYYYTGEACHAIIYNRDLTEAEVAKIYNALTQGA